MRWGFRGFYWSNTWHGMWVKSIVVIGNHISSSKVKTDLVLVTVPVVLCLYVATGRGTASPGPQVKSRNTACNYYTVIESDYWTLHLQLL